MVQIISDKPSDYVIWLGEVIERLEKYPSVQRMLVVAETNDENNSQIIEFMNCNTDDVYYIGGVLQKEAIKHEFAEEFGLDDEFWEYETEDD